MPLTSLDPNELPTQTYALKTQVHAALAQECVAAPIHLEQVALSSENKIGFYEIYVTGLGSIVSQIAGKNPDTPERRPLRRSESKGVILKAFFELCPNLQRAEG